MINKIKLRFILNRHLTNCCTFIILLSIIHLSGCEGEKGPVGPAGGVTELIINVQNKMYTSGNPDWLTIFMMILILIIIQQLYLLVRSLRTVYG